MKVASKYDMLRALADLVEDTCTVDGDLRAKTTAERAAFKVLAKQGLVTIDSQENETIQAHWTRRRA